MSNEAMTAPSGAAGKTRGAQIENRSIDYVPLSERRGKVWHQGPFWFASNFVVFTLVVGFSGPAAGLGFGWSALAILIGNLLGALFMAFHANQGPHMGVPQLIQSRAQFGMRGTVIPIVAALFVYVGFNVFNVQMATQGFQAVVGLDDAWIWYAAIIAVQGLIAVIGYDILHLVQRWLTYVMIAAFSVLTIGAVNALSDALVMGAFTPAGFFAQVAVVAGYMIAYGIYVSDYTRYLPEDTRAAPLIAWTYAGVVVAGVWLMSLGALFAAGLTGGASVASIVTVGDSIAPGFGAVAMLVAAAGVVTITAVNTYGATLVTLTGADGFRPMRLTRNKRVILTIAISLLTLAVTLTLPESFSHTVHAFLALVLYFLIPWSSVNLVDYYFVRRGRYSVLDLFKADGVYQAGAWRGLTAYAAGFVAMTPFFVLPFYKGPAAQALGGVDVSIFVGLVVAGAIYYGLTRNLDTSAEDAAIRESRAILEP